jgi:hypothetical protein
MAELEQLTGDPRVAPTWVLAREAEYELTHLMVDRRTAWAPPRLRPLASDQLPMPTQHCLGRHYQPVAAPTRQCSNKRRDQTTIGRPQRGTTRLPPEHDELMP